MWHALWVINLPVSRFSEHDRRDPLSLLLNRVLRNITLFCMLPLPAGAHAACARAEMGLGDAVRAPVHQLHSGRRRPAHLLQLRRCTRRGRAAATLLGVNTNQGKAWGWSAQQQR